jgi:polyhydroxyalkanoate synthesis regulator phasin
MAGIAVLVVAVVLAAVAVVSAQTATPTPGTGNKVVDLFERMHQAIAKALGITVEQYDTAVSTAQSDVLKQAVEEGMLTQEQADQMAERWEGGVGPMGFGGMMGGRGNKGGKRGMGGDEFGRGMMGGTSLISVAAEKLGMTVDQLTTELGSDKTIADVAKVKGVEIAIIVDAVVADRAEQLKALVTDGRMTQTQADTMLANMKEQVQKQLETKVPAGCGDCSEWMQGGPRGGFRGCWGSNDQGSTTPEGNTTLGRLPGMMRRGSY